MRQMSRDDPHMSKLIKPEIDEVRASNELIADIKNGKLVSTPSPTSPLSPSFPHPVSPSEMIDCLLISCGNEKEFL